METFLLRECTLVYSQKGKATDKKAPQSFSALEMVSLRWNKLGKAGNTNMAHVLGRWLNPPALRRTPVAMDRLGWLGRG